MTELNPGGTNLIYSTYLGGTGATAQSGAESIALDSADNAYVVGYTYSTNFPLTPNALQPRFGGTNTTTFLNYNAFVTEIASNDANLVYSTYLGGTNADVANGVAVDANNNVYIAGVTASFNFPVWNRQRAGATAHEVYDPGNLQNPELELTGCRDADEHIPLK